MRDDVIEGLAGCALFTAPAFGGVASVRLVPELGPINLLALMFFWWGGALWIGASLVSLAPRRGMTACATLAVTSEALLIVLGVGVLWRELQSAAALREVRR